MNEHLKDIVADPKFQAALGELTPALPILLRMAAEKARQVLESLAAGDTSDAMLELRREATPEEWSALAKSVVAQGNATALRAVTDRDFAVKTMLAVLLAVAGAAL